MKARIKNQESRIKSKRNLKKKDIHTFSFSLYPFSSQAGQSLVETMVAIFVLIMGITTAVGLANYAFSSSSAVNKQIVATGLAREGLEAVKSMRDTNWLRGTLSTDCVDWSSTTTPKANSAACYKDWLDPAGSDNYNISGLSGGGQAYTLDLDPNATNSSVNYWTLTPAVAGTSFNLYLDRNANATNLYPFASVKLYTTSSSGASGANTLSDYYRRVTIIQELASEPFNDSTANGTGPRLLIKSEVWWKDKKCPAVATYELASNSCRLSLQTYLTNWKAY